LDNQNELSISDKIMSEIENLPKQEKLKVLDRLKHKYFSKHDHMVIKEDEAEYNTSSNSGFTDFLGKKKVEYQQAEADWNKIKNEWIQQLNDFMKRIDDWFEAQEKNDIFSIKKSSLIIREEYLGEYKVPSRELTIGKEKVIIHPVGRLIIGAKGRIDIYSSYEKYILLYLNDRGWVYRKETDKGQFQDFSEVNFGRILEDLL